MAPLLVCLLGVLLGYLQPRKMGWLILIAAPICVYLTNWIVIDHMYITLRFNQVLFSVSMGLLLNKKIFKRLIRVLPKIRGLVAIAAFFFLELIFGLINPDSTFWKLQLAHNYPLYIGIVIISFSVVRSVSDLRFLIIIYAVFAFGLAVLAIIESQFGLNINNYFCFKNIEKCHLSEKDLIYFSYKNLHPVINDLDIFNKGAYSYYGFTAQPNLTSIIIATFSIIAIISFLDFYNKIILKYSAITLMVFALMVSMLSQIRAVTFSFLIIIITGSILFKKVIQILIIKSFFIALLFLFAPSFYSWLEVFIGNRLNLANMGIN